MAKTAGKVEGANFNLGKSIGIILFLFICRPYANGRKSYKDWYSQKPTCHLQEKVGAPRSIGKASNSRLHTVPYVTVLKSDNQEMNTFLIVKSFIYIVEQNQSENSKMGGPGSGNFTKGLRPGRGGGPGRGGASRSSISTILGIAQTKKVSLVTPTKAKATEEAKDPKETLDDLEVIEENMNMEEGEVEERDSDRIATQVKKKPATAPGVPKMLIGGNLTKPPVERSIIPLTTKAKEAITGTTYKYRICYRQKVKGTNVDYPLKLRSLLSRFMQYEKSVQLVPYDPANRSNPIVTAKDIPSDDQDFEIYAPSATVLTKSMMLHMNFRIASDVRLWKLKAMIPIRNYLTKFSIYLDENILVTIDNAKVGGLVLSNCQYTRRDQAVKDLYKRLNENEKVKIPLQLTPFVLYNGSGNNKISTKLLSVEVSKENAQEMRKRLFSKLFNLDPSMRYSNTRYFKFIPFNATGGFTDKIIRKGMFLQNQYLLQCTHITLTRISSIDWIVPNMGGISFKALALEASQKKELEKLFTSVEMGASNNKVYLVTTKDVLEEAEQWVDNFVAQMDSVSPTDNEWWKNQMGFDGPPVKYGQHDTSDAHKAYANYVDQVFTSMVGTEVEHTAPKTQPSRKTYSRVVYEGGKSSSSQRSRDTQATEASTVSSGLSSAREDFEEALNAAIQTVKESQKADSDEMKKHLEEESNITRKTLIEELKSANKEAVERFKRIEKDGESFEIMVREVHNSGKNRDAAMKQYEQRLNQISSNVATTAYKMDSIDVKVDKTNKVMQQFIGVMANAMGPDGNNGDNKANQQQLRDLANFLEEESGVDVDTSRLQAKKQKPSPGENKDVVMGGEGNVK